MRWVFGLCLLLLCACQSKQQNEYSGPLKPLLLSIGQADRIVASHVDKRIHFEISRDRLLSLVSEVKFSGFRKSFQCICYSDLVFYVFKDEQLLEVFAYFEEGAFAWHEADWSGDADLTLPSYDALSVWFHETLPTLKPLADGFFVPPPID